MLGCRGCFAACLPACLPELHIYWNMRCVHQQHHHHTLCCGVLQGLRTFEQIDELEALQEIRRKKGGRHAGKSSQLPALHGIGALGWVLAPSTVLNSSSMLALPACFCHKQGMVVTH
jgi:hypothetical protein